MHCDSLLFCLDECIFARVMMFVFDSIWVRLSLAAVNKWFDFNFGSQRSNFILVRLWYVFHSASTNKQTKRANTHKQHTSAPPSKTDLMKCVFSLLQKHLVPFVLVLSSFAEIHTIGFEFDMFVPRYTTIGNFFFVFVVYIWCISSECMLHK